ncbi:hypothetical protein CAPN004_16700 [Capnocytophaga cynodegmi]|uniref:hypothetical protein n=1 Tax=Capnocytophaga cynodegmi TaxID=28189 RepID=UPI001ACC6D92|nr:hypothetical protein [Capnocytophaga cynodegmi]GIM52640.1 hypothetical protein CAPN004_16700 [Capnocytophaga cynodegmi]
MENTVKNTENQPQDDGLELLKRLIKTNEKHIEESVKLNFLYEDFLNLLGENESTLRGIKPLLRDMESLVKEEKEERIQFLEKLEVTKLDLSKQAIDGLDQFENKLKSLKNNVNGSIWILLLSIVILVITSFSAKYWFAESVRTRMEVREESLREIDNEGKGIYEKTYINDLENNTKMMQEFVRKNPSEGSKLVHFKSGFDARKEQQGTNKR